MTNTNLTPALINATLDRLCARSTELLQSGRVDGICTLTVGFAGYRETVIIDTVACVDGFLARELAAILAELPGAYGDVAGYRCLTPEWS